MKDQEPKRYPRRWILKRAIETGLVLTSAEVILDKNRKDEDRTRNYHESNGALWENRIQTDDEYAVYKPAITEQLENPLEVKYFSGSIVGAAYDITGSISDKTLLELSAGGVVGNFLFSYLLKNEGLSVNGKFGIGAFLAARVVDVISTLENAKHMENPKFKEYGLDNYFYEQNRMLPASPSQVDVIAGNIKDLPLVVPLAYAAPFAGRTYMGLVPGITINNLKIAQTIGMGINIGDSVKNMISEGKNQDDIFRYLNAFSKV